MSGPLLLAIESSCDETGIAIVDGGRRIVANVVASQVALHAPMGGIVPEVAARAHVRWIVPVLEAAWTDAGVDWRDIDGVAVTYGPGLAGSLLVGINFAKALAWSRGLPLVGVNHLEGHLHAAFLEDPDMALPAVVLLVSGGHTMLVHVRAPGRYRLLGQTIDDAAGEAFDKVARFLDLGYPGGPAVEREAAGGDPRAVAFPRGLRHDGFDFSFSGLKTSVITYVRKHPEALTADVAASFQEAVVDVLVEKTMRAAAAIDARSVCIGGGVAANGVLRARLVSAAQADGRAAFLPSRAMCTDNAAMVGATAWYRLRLDGPTPLNAAANPNLRLPLEG